MCLIIFQNFHPELLFFGHSISPLSIKRRLGPESTAGTVPCGEKTGPVVGSSVTKDHQPDQPFAPSKARPHYFRLTNRQSVGIGSAMIAECLKGERTDPVLSWLSI